MRRVLLSAGLVLVLLMVLQRPAASQPTTVDDSADATITGSVLVNVTANDSPAPLKLVAVSEPDPPIGSVEIKDNQVLYTPYPVPADAAGEPPVPEVGTEVVITYTVEDDLGGQADGTLTVTLTNPCPPLAINSINLPCLSEEGTPVFRCAIPSYCQSPNIVVKSNLRCQYDYVPGGEPCVGGNNLDGFCLGTSPYCRTPPSRPFKG